MKTIRHSMVLLAGVAALASFGAGKPVALVGDGGEALTIRADVTDAMPVKTVFQERLESRRPPPWHRCTR